jgi:hypothetical protein
VPECLLDDPRVLARRVAVHVQCVDRSRVAVPDQLQVHGAPVVVGQRLRQAGVLDGGAQQHPAGQFIGFALILAGVLIVVRLPAGWRAGKSAGCHRQPAGDSQRLSGGAAAPPGSAS